MNRMGTHGNNKFKIGFLGAGNLAQSMMKAFIDSGTFKPEEIIISGRNEKKLAKIAEEFKVAGARTNEQLIDESDMVVIGVKPQDFYMAIEPIASSFHNDHTIISLAAGISLSSLERLIPNTRKIIRVMPNTASKVRKSVIAYAASRAAAAHVGPIEKMLSVLGLVVPVEDGEMMEALLVAASSGIGFVYELMIYWQEWLAERGLGAQVSRDITTQVFLGAAEMAIEARNTSFDELLKKVASTKGVTAAGLDSMRELEIERALRISFEKAAMRDRELGNSWLNSDQSK